MSYNQITTGTQVIACVAIQGARRGTGWRYTQYEADHRLVTGYRSIGRVLSGGMYPNKVNYEWSECFEADMERRGYIVLHGRPDQRKTSHPTVIEGGAA